MIKLENLKKRHLSDRERLLALLDAMSKTSYYLTQPFSFYEEHLQIAHTTFKTYLRALRDAGALKFRFKGIIYLNPSVFVFGERSEAEEQMLSFAYNNMDSD